MNVRAVAFLLAAAALWLTLRHLAALHPSRPGRWAVKTACGIQCGFCPNRCYLPEGNAGKCGVRFNRLGEMGYRE